MLYDFTKKDGNTFNGFGVKHVNAFLPDACDCDCDPDIDDLNITVNGSLAHRFLTEVGKTQDIKKTLACNRVRIRRGVELHNSVHDDVMYNGYFSVKRGNSVQNHLHLVDICKDEYSKTVKHIEDSSIGVKSIDGRTLVDGRSFDFIFKEPIDDLDLFITRLFNSTEPFKLWGLKSKVLDNYYKITAVDLHAGTTINFDMANDLMRVYLLKGDCGNTIMRLFTNLQRHYDSRIECSQLVA